MSKHINETNRKFFAEAIQAIDPSIDPDRIVIVDDYGEDCFRFGEYYVFVSEKPVTMKTIAGPRIENRLEWIIQKEVFIPGSYWEPDDVNLEDLTTATNLGQAALRIYNDINTYRINNFMESKMMEDLKRYE